MFPKSKYCWFAKFGKNSYIKTQQIASVTLRTALNVPRFSLENIVTSNFLNPVVFGQIKMQFRYPSKNNTSRSLLCNTLSFSGVTDHWPKKGHDFRRGNREPNVKVFGKQTRVPWNDGTKQTYRAFQIALKSSGQSAAIPTRPHGDARVFTAFSASLLKRFLVRSRFREQIIQLGVLVYVHLSLY